MRYKTIIHGKQVFGNYKDLLDIIKNLNYIHLHKIERIMK